MSDINNMITIAVPKGRVLIKLTEYLANIGIKIEEISRRLDYIDKENGIRFLFVKNSDVPVYVYNGVAELGIVGSDVLYEHNCELLQLMTLPFGGTKICIAGYKKDSDLLNGSSKDDMFIKEIRIATKFEKFTKDYFKTRNIPIRLISLTGSVELAPILGLSDLIVDLVETGQTLIENDLSVLDVIGTTTVKLVACKGLYKQRFRQIDTFISKLKLVESKNEKN